MTFDQHQIAHAHLRVFKSQFTGKFLPVWFADVLLLLESSLQGFPLQV